MTTITVVPEVNGDAGTVFWAVAGDRQACGNTLGAAIDALISILGDGDQTHLTINAQLSAPTEWKYLSPFPSGWRKQLRFTGSRLRPFTVWHGMEINNMTPEQAAENWDLSVEQVEEAIRYCEQNQELLWAEAAVDRRAAQKYEGRIEPETVA